MNKYRELPAFEKNEFNEGDLVNCYNAPSGSLPFVLKITGIFQDFIYGDLPDSKEGDESIGAHFKACRKLEELKPREWEVYLDKQGTIISYNAMKDFCWNDVKTIRVREILDE